MSVRIRLRRVGRKKQPYYRVVVMNSTASRDSAYIDEVGFYNPRTQPASLRLDLEKVDQWLAQGAELTDSAASLVRKARKGGDASVHVVKPGEEGPVKTAAMKAKRPKSQPVAEKAMPASSGGAAEPSEETIAKAEPQVEAKAEPEIPAESGVVATPANEEKAEPAEAGAEAAAEAPAIESEAEAPAAEAAEPAAEAEPASEAEPAEKPKKKASKKKAADEGSEA